MKNIKTIPVYNKKGQRITSITTKERDAINEALVDDRFFILEQHFIVIKNKFFRQEHLVKNVKFYIHKQDVHFKKQENLTYKKVLFILESPHKKEFDYEKDFQPLKPLVGSFETFRTTFYKLMEEISPEEHTGYEVTLYNPIPFQTSLHYLLRKNANERTKFNFWLYGWWNLKYNKEFTLFLETHKFDYYINASTRAFKPLISNKLAEVVPTEYQVYHPSSGFWNRKEVRFGVKRMIHLDDSHPLFHQKQNNDESIF